jgi:hypothetical protein
MAAAVEAASGRVLQPEASASDLIADVARAGRVAFELMELIALPDE